MSTDPRCAKIGYRTRVDARIALALMPDNPKRHETRVYRCPRCGRWHLTSQQRAAT